MIERVISNRTILMSKLDRYLTKEDQKELVEHLMNRGVRPDVAHLMVEDDLSLDAARKKIDGPSTQRRPSSDRLP